MYCKQCGRRIHDQAVICPTCKRMVNSEIELGNPVAVVGFIITITLWICFLCFWGWMRWVVYDDLSLDALGNYYLYFYVLNVFVVHIVAGFILNIIGWIKGWKRRRKEGLAIVSFILSLVLLIFVFII